MKILVLRFSSIGDIVLTTPVIRAMHEQLPGAEVHVATKGAFADLLRYNPHVHRVHELGDDLGALVASLRAERFDHVVDLHHNLRTARVKRALGLPAHSFPKRNVEKWLLVNFGVNKLPLEHIVDRYLTAAAPLGVRNDNKGLELFVPSERAVPLSVLPGTHREGYTAMAVGAAHGTKRLPGRRLVELAHLVRGPLVIVGGAEDRPVGRRIADAIGARAYDATGRYDLLGSASLLAGARSVIAHDSGAMHMACAFNRPVVSIWGSTVPAFGMGPYQPEHAANVHISEVEGLSCRPCSKIGHDRCPKGHFHCMELQNLKRIAALVTP